MTTPDTAEFREDNVTNANEIIEKNKSKKHAPAVDKVPRRKLIEDYLNNTYEFRFNVIKQKPEYRVIDTDYPWQAVDKFKLNSIIRELQLARIQASGQTIKEVLESDYSEAVNPIKDYFIREVSKIYDGHDHIKDLADTVKVRNKDFWYNYLRKWLVGVVANALIDEECKNHCCLVLTGEQGKFKTTWLDNLCPKSLRQYLVTTKINPENKDILTYIAEFLFINIDDQLRELNKRDENTLKNLITIPYVKYRRPYDPYITEYPHLCSFMASVNGNDFLTDPTGSRRFLPFEALDININAAQKMDMDKVWAQAYHLFSEKFRYWFNDDEIKDLYKNNESFSVYSKEQELINEYFRKPATRAEATHHFQGAKIQAIIEEHTKTRLSSKKLGEALTKMGYEKWRMTRDNQTIYVWSVVQKEGEELGKQNEQQKPSTKDEEAPF